MKFVGLKQKFVGRKTGVLPLIALLALVSAAPANAFTAPVAGDMMYDVYNTLINSLISGGITYIIAFIGFLVAAYFLMQQKIVPGLFCMIGAAVIANVVTITTAFGLVC